MTYEEFLERRRAGTVKAGIDRSMALALVRHLPERYQTAYMLWCWLWMLSIPGFICVSIFWKWWVGLLLLFFLTPVLFRAAKERAAQFVLGHAEKDKEFFETLLEGGLLLFKDDL